MPIFNSDYKTRFQEMAQENLSKLQLLDDVGTGPDHDKVLKWSFLEQQVAAHGKSKKKHLKMRHKGL